MASNCRARYAPQRALTYRPLHRKEFRLTHPAFSNDEQRTAALQTRLRARRDRPVPVHRQVWRRLTAKHRGRRLAALALAIGVPAMAAPEGWRTLTGREADPQTAPAPTPMPFETAGFSFPGSAFYYIEQSPGMVPVAEDREFALFDMSGTGGADGPPQAALVVPERAGPAARGFSLTGGGMDQARALQCMTQAIYYEAASEADGGQRAVAQVVLNRVSHPSYPNSVCGVVFQGSQRRTGCQFSFTCDGSMRRTPSAGAWARAQQHARRALTGSVFEPVGLATHYHTVWIYPYWAPSLDHIGTIGAHRFYRWKGKAGKPAAFRARYAGLEPSAARNTRLAGMDGERAGIDPLGRADPIALAKAYETGRLKALETDGAPVAPATRTPPVRGPAPRYSAPVEQRGGDALYRAENLPTGSTVRPEYANSGRWIAEPN